MAVFVTVSVHQCAYDHKVEKVANIDDVVHSHSVFSILYFISAVEMGNAIAPAPIDYRIERTMKKFVCKSTLTSVCLISPFKMFQIFVYSTPE